MSLNDQFKIDITMRHFILFTIEAWEHEFVNMHMADITSVLVGFIIS